MICLGCFIRLGIVLFFAAGIFALYGMACWLWMAWVMLGCPDCF